MSTYRTLVIVAAVLIVAVTAAWTKVTNRYQGVGAHRYVEGQYSIRPLIRSVTEKYKGIHRIGAPRHLSFN